MRHLQTLATLLLAAVVATPGIAVAQVVIDGVQIRPEDIPRVRSQCDELAVRARASLLDDEGADLLEPSSDPASSYSQGASTIDNAFSRYDLDRLTVAKCRAAGLL